MFFLNLGLGQFLVLFGAVSAISVALYLLDRSRRRIVVSTLRFWTAAEQPTAVQRRKHIQQPLSLILQLLAMLLLLLAISQLRIGSEAGMARRHVLILETSAWMGARANSRQTLMDLARTRALAYLHALPAKDEVMLIRADALATPATPFESDRQKLEAAIAGSEPASTSLNLEQALAVAKTAQGNAGGRGEIAFVGSGLVNEPDAITQDTSNLRVLLVGNNTENMGLRKIGLRRAAGDSEVWEILVTVHNYGSRVREAVISAAVSASPAGAQRLVLAPHSEQEATFSYRTRATGILQVRLLPNDAFPGDNRAQVELPASAPLAVTVYSDKPEALKPLLAAAGQITAVYKTTAQYVETDKGLVMLDNFRPAKRPLAPSIWIDPPAEFSPIPIRARISNPSQLRWLTDNPLGLGLRTRDVRLSSASVFNTAPGDIKVAETDQGPVIVARPANPKMVAIGFHPSAMRYELATPLLFANIFRWIAPDTFVEKQINTQPVGTVNVTVASGTDPASIRVLRSDNSAVPFTIQGESLHFFSGAPGTVRVISGEREAIYSLSLPELADGKWAVPPNARKGLPTFRDARSSHDIWQILAVAAAGLLLFEWMRWGQAVKRISAAIPSRLRKVA